jgi:hypothetical protein
MRKKWIVMAPLAVLALLLFIAVGGEAVRLLWNWLLPPLFGWHQITFWEALGLLALCRILFGGFGGRGYRPSLRRRIAERWDRMTPEEREQFRQGLRARCGLGPSAGESKAQ